MASCGSQARRVPFCRFETGGNACLATAGAIDTLTGLCGDNGRSAVIQRHIPFQTVAARKPARCVDEDCLQRAGYCLGHANLGSAFLVKPRNT